MRHEAARIIVGGEITLTVPSTPTWTVKETMESAMAAGQLPTPLPEPAVCC
jgi:hypothetical protein